MDTVLDAIPPRRAPLVALALAAATILGALFFEHVLGILPCELCLDQRWPYYIAIPVLLVALFISREANLGHWGEWLMTAAGLIFVVSAGLAFRHMGVEWGWWAGPSGCSGGGGGVAGSVADLGAQLSGAKVIRCDEVAWSFLGLSLAGYNFLISLALAGICLIPAWAAWKERHET